MKKKATAGPSSPLQGAREAAGLNREGLAFKAGVSLKTIERIETGGVQPHRATLKAIADALEVELAAIEPLPKATA